MEVLAETVFGRSVEALFRPAHPERAGQELV